MKKLIKISLLPFLIGGHPALGYMAEDYRRTFYDPQNLAEATKTILTMEEKELRSFTTYLAECSSSRTGDIGKHLCEVAFSKYEIEFGSNRILDQMIYANKLLENFPEKIQDSHELARKAIEHAKVTSSLSDSANRRFQILRSQQ